MTKNTKISQWARMIPSNWTVGHFNDSKKVGVLSFLSNCVSNCVTWTSVAQLAGRPESEGFRVSGRGLASVDGTILVNKERGPAFFMYTMYQFYDVIWLMTLLKSLSIYRYWLKVCPGLFELQAGWNVIAALNTVRNLRVDIWGVGGIGRGESYHGGIHAVNLRGGLSSSERWSGLSQTGRDLRVRGKDWYDRRRKAKRILTLYRLI
jgi:hypothetical protein